MAQARYRKTAGAVFNLQLHLVWCPKYRRKILTDDIETRLKELIYQKAQELGVEIEGLEVMPDHVHLFIVVPPTNALQFYANQFKGFTSRILREEFPLLKSRLPSLWSRSYYAGSAGHVSADVIKSYIENQSRRASATQERGSAHSGCSARSEGVA